MGRNVLLDTNVVLDALLARPLFVDDARELLQSVERGDLNACVCATTVTTIDYLLAKSLGAAESRRLIAVLLSLCKVAAVTGAVINDALLAPMSDFEDAVIVESARACGVPTIITRNGKDFRGCGLNIYSPREWLASSGL